MNREIFKNLVIFFLIVAASLIVVAMSSANDRLSYGFHALPAAANTDITRAIDPCVSPSGDIKNYDPKTTNGTATGPAPQCGFNELIQLVQNIINFLLYISIPIVAIMFTWAGILYYQAIITGGSADKAKGVFWHVLWGFLLMLSAWLIVNTISSRLIKPELIPSFVKP